MCLGGDFIRVGNVEPNYAKTVFSVCLVADVDVPGGRSVQEATVKQVHFLVNGEGTASNHLTWFIAKDAFNSFLGNGLAVRACGMGNPELAACSVFPTCPGD